MRVAFIINAMGRGGAEIQVVDLATELVRRGHAVMVVVLMPFEDFEVRLQEAGVMTLSLGLRKGQASLAAQTRLLRAMWTFAPDVLHGHMFAGNIAARTTAALLRISRRRPLVVSTVHTPRESVRRYAAYRVTHPFCDLFTCVSNESLVLHREGGAVPKNAGIVVPNGIPLSLWHPPSEAERREARAALGGLEGFVWLALGSFRDEQKDYSNLLRAFRLVRAERPTARLLIGGEGRLLESKREEARRLGLSACVDFLGLRSDVGKLMHAADGFVMASAWEALPIVLLEAAASGLPMVVTDVGANADVVTDGLGLRVPAKDPHSLARAMLTTMSRNPDDRRATGREARAHVQQQYAIESVVTRWEHLYKSLA